LLKLSFSARWLTEVAVQGGGGVPQQQFSFSIFEDALWGLARFFEE